MADKNNDFDKLFKDALSGHTSSPDPEVWEKLSASLENKKAGMVFPGWKWAVAAAVVLVSFWLIYQPINVTVKDSTIAVKDTKFSEKKPFLIPPPAEFSEKEKVKRQTKNIATESITESKKFTTKEKPAKALQQESLPIKERVREQLPQVLAQIEPNSKDELTKTISKQLAFDTSIIREEQTEKPNKDYKVKIISNGYAIQPEKEQLVEGLENKIGGFFTKVDEGFGDLRDAKNNLFASLTTKREKKKKLTN